MYLSAIERSVKFLAACPTLTKRNKPFTHGGEITEHYRSTCSLKSRCVFLLQKILSNISAHINLNRIYD